jgi:hypothetical protein
MDFKYEYEEDIHVSFPTSHIELWNGFTSEWISEIKDHLLIVKTVSIGQNTTHIWSWRLTRYCTDKFIKVINSTVFKSRVLCLITNFNSDFT